MIVPSIDIEGGRVVQLRGGEERVLTVDDPIPLAERFARVGEIAVIDLDAAKGVGSNRDIVRELVEQFPCRVGGGIRDAATARAWLDRGARKVILGTAARPEVLAELPRERVLAAVDARDGEVVVEGWRKGTGEALLDRISTLREFVGGFLVTFVEREGRLGGLDTARIAAVLEAAEGTPVTFAGGVRDADDVATLHRLGADAQVGMALYQGHLDVGDAVFRCATSEREDGLVPTVVCDESGRALGLVYSSAESLRQAIDSGRGTYHSRRRGVWVKGQTSGATQELLAVGLDCDADVLRFTVRQAGVGFCHRGTATCFGPATGLRGLLATLRRRAAAPERGGSYTRRLLEEPAFLRGKLLEEAAELAAAESPSDVVHEAADLLYFTSVALTRAGVRLAAVEEELDRRALLVTRRSGEVKPPSGAGPTS